MRILLSFSTDRCSVQRGGNERSSSALSCVTIIGTILARLLTGTHYGYGQAVEVSFAGETIIYKPEK